MASSSKPTFSISVDKFDRPSPTFQTPTVIGSYSKDFDEQEISKTRPFNRYLYRGYSESNLNLNLEDGLETYVNKEHDDISDFNNFLQWLKFHLREDVDQSIKPDFYCGKGLLAKILTSPYEKNKPLTFMAQKFNGSIYLLDWNMDMKKRQHEKEDKVYEYKLMFYGGYKFQQYMTTNTVDGVPITDVPVLNTTPHFTVVNVRLGDHTIVVKGRVACYLDEYEMEYVKLKTSGKLINNKKRNNFIRYKLIQYWAQSVILAIPKVVCGFRNDDAVVESIKTYYTDDIPEMGRQAAFPWKDNVCLNCCNDFLTFLKKVITDDDKVYWFSFTPGKYPFEVSYKIVDNVEVLTQEFMDEFKTSD